MSKKTIKAVRMWKHRHGNGQTSIEAKNYGGAVYPVRVIKEDDEALINQMDEAMRTRSMDPFWSFEDLARAGLSSLGLLSKKGCK